MALSSLPSGGPSLPAGAQKVSLKEIDSSATTKNVDVTVLADNERKYASPPLKDKTNGATASCSASGLLKGGEPGVTPITVKSGWICSDCEVTYEVGKYATWSANYTYIPPEE